MDLTTLARKIPLNSLVVMEKGSRFDGTLENTNF
jgi:hypothetical protein